MKSRSFLRQYYPSRFIVPKEFIFLTSWILLPTFFRTLTIYRLYSSEDHSKLIFSISSGLFLGIWQDLIIGLEIFFVLLLFQKMTKSRFGFLSLYSIVFIFLLIIHSYMLSDLILQWHLGSRMNQDFLHFLSRFNSFWSSAKLLGLDWIFLALSILAIYTISLTGFVHKLGNFKFSYSIAFLFAISLALTFITKKLTPPAFAYNVNSVLLNDQVEIANKILKRKPFHSLQGIHDSHLAMKSLLPKAEKYQAISAEYPLLRKTEGFTGGKLFNIAVKREEKPHVILLFMESFRAKDIGILGNTLNLTPQFDRLAKEGILFSNFYANGVETTRAVMASLFGILPNVTSKSVQSENPGIPLIGLPHIFKESNYLNAYIHNGSLKFEGKENFFSQQGYDVILGKNDIRKRFPEAEGTSWGVHDEYLMEFTTEWLEQKNKQRIPTFLTMFTVTNHHPWTIPSNHVSPKLDFSEGSLVKRFLQSVHYSDYCLGKFIRLLKERGLSKNTLIFVLADTGQPMFERDRYLRHKIYDEDVHIPLLILAEGRIQKPKFIHDIGSQIDLLPTIMDVLGFKGLNHSMGTSLMRQVPNRKAYFYSGNLLCYFGKRVNRLKYIYTAASKADAVFNIPADINEITDVSHQFPAFVNHSREELVAIYGFTYDLYKKELFAPRSFPIFPK